MAAGVNYPPSELFMSEATRQILLDQWPQGPLARGDRPAQAWSCVRAGDQPGLGAPRLLWRGEAGLAPRRGER